jgi:hypothetical protein
MTGIFADNQPDFTWLDAYEEKRFVQYFLPYHTRDGTERLTGCGIKAAAQ